MDAAPYGRRRRPSNEKIKGTAAAANTNSVAAINMEYSQGISLAMMSLRAIDGASATKINKNCDSRIVYCGVTKGANRNMTLIDI
jgi:hypothetical protein